ncbi:vWA domain-containing protein [Lignipirellula cremea]|uniref:VWFA domain-containing protein n=1 Tax=Lignipirellula cremea TaxID=2528010 RepID=A0A518E1S2_9BACT|nr:vWA domain-containing protein [Lignipirellula cremea]QDU98039.1 hypothetical protein Pla8534_59000 [Lignipirellula cremea]
MNPLKMLRTWWQQRTGEEETPFDGDAPYWLVSMVFHLCLMFALALTPLAQHLDPEQIAIVTPPEPEELIDESVDPIENVFSNERPQEEIGANSEQGITEAMSMAAVLSDISDVPSPLDLEIQDHAKIEINETVAIATGLHFNENLAVTGASGEGATGAVGAVDRITHEILLSLEERKTLVVWLFDQSLSLAQQRQDISSRFDRIYEELGVLEASENSAFTKHADKPLLTQVIGFGEKITVALENEDGVDNLAEIKEAVAGLPLEAGTERVFTAVHMAATKYKHLRSPNPLTGEPERNVMIICITDERGDDTEGLDQTVALCRKYQMPVYVVGVPAPFGQEETQVKIDPSLGYDQDWGVVSQGPESLAPERVKIGFSAQSEMRSPIDSGFGPFALTRLCYETSGIFFTVHPNRNVNREVRRGEIGNFSSHLSHFFDPEVMRRYKPDYVSANEYKKRLMANKARASLVMAANSTWVGELENPQLTFERRDEAAFVNSLTESQKDAAKLMPKAVQLYSILAEGEGDREKEIAPRWQAGYDLAMGQVLAVYVRTQSYNAMLAQLKSGKKFENPKSNTWKLEGDNEMVLDSRTEKMQQRALEYLTRVVEDHPGTPWALIASQELEKPIGWKLVESYTAPPAPMKPGMGGGGNNNAAAKNDEARRLEREGPKKKLPKL